MALHYLDSFNMTLARGHDEGRPPVLGLLVDGQLDLAGMKAGEDGLQHVHVALLGAVVEYGLTLL